MAIDFSFLDNAAPRKEEVPVKSDTANVTIRVDADSMLLCDGEYIDQQFKAGVITKIQLPTGQHLLEFLSEENPDVKVEKVVDFIEAGKSYLVMVNELKAALSKSQAEATFALGTQKKYRLVVCGYVNQMGAMMAVRQVFGWSSAESREKLSNLPAVLIESEDYARIEVLAKQFAQNNVNVSIETRNGLGELITSNRLQTKEEIEAVEAKRKAEAEAKRKAEEAAREARQREMADTCVIPEGIEALNDEKDFIKYYKGESKIILPSTLKRLGKMQPAIDDEMMIDVGYPRCAVFWEKKREITDSRIKEVDMSRCTKLEIIGVGTFACCCNLSKVNLPNSLKEIKACAFNDCRNLEEIVIPENTHIIGESAFAYCKRLKKVYFKNPYGVDIHFKAFKSCENLEYFNADTQPSNAFKGCKKLGFD